MTINDMRIKVAHPSVGLYVLTHNVTLGITKASRGSRRDVILKSNEARKHWNRKTFFFFHLAVNQWSIDRFIWILSCVQSIEQVVTRVVCLVSKWAWERTRHCLKYYLSEVGKFVRENIRSGFLVYYYYFKSRSRTLRKLFDNWLHQERRSGDVAT